MDRKRELLQAVIAAALLATGTAHAQTGSGFMPVNGLATQPIGHYELCLRKPSECSQTADDPKPVKLTRALWEGLVNVNDAVNSAIQPRTDAKMWGLEEYWSYPDGFGDCEDYVLEKRRQLMRLGMPAESLLITVVQQPNGDGHAVLTISTSLGDYILDNLEPRILAWTNTKYTYLKRQSARNSGQWTAIIDARAATVGSIPEKR